MYICRQWTETEHGWTSDMDTFATWEQAVEHGEIFSRLIRHDEKSREYEVYEQE